MKHSILFLVVVLTLFSCATKKEIIYFQDLENQNQKEIETPFEPIIEPNDILYISVSSLNPEVVAPFIKKSKEESGVNSNRNPGLDGYLVTSEGMIRFPVIGDISVAGNTRSEVVVKLREALSVHVKDVVVDVRIMNFDITILGEVTNPGVYTIEDERVTLLEAIALAGDLTDDGKRSTIKVIRENNGKRLVQNIDFTSSEFFNSDFYYLKQNDVVVVNPSLKGVKRSGFIPDVPALISLFTVILSSIIIITR